MKKIIVFGAGTFGKRVATRAADLGSDVTCVDRVSDRLKGIKDYVSSVQVLECRDEKAVKEKLRSGFDVAIIAMHRDFSTVLLLVIYTREMGIKQIIARAETAMQKQVLEKLGVEEIILPEWEMGQRIAERLALNKSDQLALTSDMGIVHIPVPQKLIGRRIDDLSPLDKYALKLIFVRREYLDQNFSRVIEPSEGETELIEDDFLVILGKPRRIAKMIDDLS